MEKNGVVVDPAVNYSNVLPTGEVRISPVSLSSAILQYLTACANLQNTNSPDLNFSVLLSPSSGGSGPPTLLSSQQQSLLIVRLNSIYTLMPALLQTRNPIS
jgi:hypothetical protein